MAMLLSSTVWLVPAAYAQTNVITLTPPAPEGAVMCQSLDPTAVPFCAHVNYSIGLPNFRDHQDLNEANAELVDFKRLIESGCSGAILTFLCAYYVPFCFTPPRLTTSTILRPCRDLCVEVRDKCEYLLQCQGRSWPSHLNCQDLPDKPSPCFGPNHPSLETIPSDIDGLSVVSIVPASLTVSCAFGPRVPMVETMTSVQMHPTPSMSPQGTATPALPRDSSFPPSSTLAAIVTPTPPARPLSSSYVTPSLRRPPATPIIGGTPPNAASKSTVHLLTIAISCLCVLLVLVLHHL